MVHSSKCGSEILKNISLLDAIYWIDRRWKEVETSTIVKCYKNCGFFDMQNDNLPTIEVDVMGVMMMMMMMMMIMMMMSHLLSYSCQGNFSVETS